MHSTPTSLDAYAHLVVSGILSERRLEAWLALEQWGPMTARELDDQVKRRGLWKRLSELQRMGLVKERTVRLCRITHHSAIVWQHVPVEPGRVYTRPVKLTKPVYLLSITPAGGVVYAGLDRAAAERMALAWKGDVVRAREVKRWTPK